MAGRSVSPPPTRFGLVAAQPQAANVQRKSRPTVPPPDTRFAAGGRIQPPIQRKIASGAPPPTTRFGATAVVQREPATTTIVAGALVVATGIIGFGRYMNWWGGAVPPAGGGGQGQGGPPAPQNGAAPVGSGGQGQGAPPPPQIKPAPAPAAPAKPSPSELNRQKQLAENKKKREEAQQKDAEAKQRKAEQEEARRAKNEKQREEEAARAKVNQEKAAEHKKAEEVRWAAIDTAVSEFKAAHLDATVANQIGNNAKENNHGVERARTDLQRELTRQRNPPLDRWRFALGMNQEPNNYALLHRNAAGQAFPQHGGERIHITFDKKSIAAAPGPVNAPGKDASTLTDDLLSSPVRHERIHATLENQVPLNHYFYGDVPAGDRADKQALKAVLDAYIASDIRPRVQRAIDREGDI